MTQESYSDFSIVKDYIELKGKYDFEIKQYQDKIKSMEEKVKKHSAALEGEIRKRNEMIKALETKVKEMTQMNAEKDEQLKNMGLQLHKLKLGAGRAQD